MSIVALPRPPLVRVNGRRMRPARPMGDVSLVAVAEAAKRAAQIGLVQDEEGEGQRRARLMLLAKANLHFASDMPTGNFVIIDPATMDDQERAEAESAGITSRTLVLSPNDIDRAIEHFEKEKGARA